MSIDARLRAIVSQAWGPVQRRLEARRPSDGAAPWNHNVAYHRVVLDAVPARCERALDVGCGQGFLLVELAPRCGNVLGIEPDDEARRAAIERTSTFPNVMVTDADVLASPLPVGAFDLAVAVSVLHHLPLRTGLQRLVELVAPGGRLVVIGLATPSRVTERIRWALGFFPANALVALRGHTPVGAPTRDVEVSMADIRHAAAQITPGARIRIHWLFRYSLVWTKPDAPTMTGEAQR